MKIKVFTVRNGVEEYVLKDVFAERLNGYVETFKRDVEDCYSADACYTLGDKARARVINYLLALYDSEVINYDFKVAIGEHFCDMISLALDERLDNI